MIQLRDYQEDISNKAAALLRDYGIAYLAMEVRTGKTFTAFATAQKYGAISMLFITKKKAISSIRKDYKAMAPAFQIEVTNYEQVANMDGSLYDLIVLDEAHCLGQFPALAERVKVLKKICAGKPIIYLSGTPTPESYSQLYHQLCISTYSPFHDYPTFYKWAADFVTIGKKYFYNRQINDYSNANKTKIDDKTRYLFLSFTQSQAGFKQEVKEEKIFVTMKPATYALAKRLARDRVYVSAATGAEVLADTAAKLMQKLHQIYSGSVIADNNDTGIIFDYSKIDLIKRCFTGKKIAIYYKFKAEEQMIRSAIGDGSLTTDPMEFNNREDKWFYSQVQSGREGINLSTADAIIMLNIDFSAVSYWQARARMQDKDRTKECLLYWIFAKDGIEEKIHKTVMSKRNYTLSHFKKDYGLKAEKEVQD